jgi:uncharacterized protein (TIGR01777 family)
MPTVLITGGTGLIGKALSSLLIRQGYRVVIFSRGLSSARQGQDPALLYASWDVNKQTYDRTAVESADYIVHLAGAGVADKRWSAKRKKEIEESRTGSCALLVRALKETDNHVKAVVSSSAIGWYGPDPVIPNPKPFVETDAASDDFLGKTCKLWEESIDPVARHGRRLVKIRTGLVLSGEGGAFAEFSKPVKFGIAGILGSGKQVISWIHMEDLCRIYLMAIEDNSLSGVYNGVAPKPVNNKELTLQIAKTMKSNFYIPMYVPSFALRIVFGELSVEVLKSATVNCDKIRKAGFNFVFPSIESAVNDLARPKK